MPELQTRSVDAPAQLRRLASVAIPPFSEKAGAPLFPQNTRVLQVNLGKLCNQTCSHCHVDAGPFRKEIMKKETMESCLRVLPRSPVSLVDLTGGAPEMNPDFRWFVEALRRQQKKVMVRTNLTIVLANRKFSDLPQFFADNGVHLVCSLPCYEKETTDRQRGSGVYEKSLAVIRQLNEVGYGIEEDLRLDIVHNPPGPFLPSSEKQLESLYRRNLDIKFNQLFALNNMPISRFFEDLDREGNIESYLELLLAAFSSEALDKLMCRSLISVGWDGTLYDCDFNQMLELPILDEGGSPLHLSNLNWDSLEKRRIRFDQHCYGCTAGAGSACSSTR